MIKLFRAAMTVPTLASVVVFLAAILPILAQVTRPTEGYEITNVPNNYDIIFPLSIVQCEPVLIYYNNIGTDWISVDLHAPDGGYILQLDFPPGVGYLDWICNIPSGHTLYALASLSQTFTVQPGSSSACFG